MDVRGQCQTARDLAFRIVVAKEQEDGDFSLGKPAHLLHEKEAGLIVPPIAVIEVTCNDDEIDLIFDGLAYEIIEREPGSRPYPFGCRALLPGEPLEGAIKMNVPGMN